jgi:hypothetical protein
MAAMTVFSSVRFVTDRAVRARRGSWIEHRP